MKKLRYQNQQVYNWAEFSNDFNPIHFDDKHAQKMNITATPIHGMLAMLDIKSALFDHFKSKSNNGLRYRGSLRSHIFQEKDYLLNLDNKKQKLNYTLTNSDTEASCLSGYMGEFSYDLDEITDSPIWKTKNFHIEDLDALIPKFQTCLDGNQPLWIFLDGLLFREILINDDLFLSFIKKTNTHKTYDSVKDLMDKMTVVQTHHNCLLSESIQQDYLLPLFFSKNNYSITCVIRQPTIDGNDTDGFVVDVDVDAFCNNTFLLRTSVNLKIFNNEEV